LPPSPSSQPLRPRPPSVHRLAPDPPLRRVRVVASEVKGVIAVAEAAVGAGTVVAMANAARAAAIAATGAIAEKGKPITGPKAGADVPSVPTGLLVRRPLAPKVSIRIATKIADRATVVATNRGAKAGVSPVAIIAADPVQSGNHVVPVHQLPRQAQVTSRMPRSRSSTRCPTPKRMKEAITQANAKAVAAATGVAVGVAIGTTLRRSALKTANKQAQRSSPPICPLWERLSPQRVTGRSSLAMVRATKIPKAQTGDGAAADVIAIVGRARQRVRPTAMAQRPTV
jgi:hypothetical protein